MSKINIHAGRTLNDIHDYIEEKNITEYADLLTVARTEKKEWLPYVLGVEGNCGVVVIVEHIASNRRQGKQNVDTKETRPDSPTQLSADETKPQRRKTSRDSLNSDTQADTLDKEEKEVSMVEETSPFQFLAKTFGWITSDDEDNNHQTSTDVCIRNRE